MGRDQYAAAGGRDRLELRAHSKSRGRVERRGGLIGEQDSGSRRECASEHRSLSLPAGASARPSAHRPGGDVQPCQDAGRASSVAARRLRDGGHQRAQRPQLRNRILPGIRHQSPLRRISRRDPRPVLHARRSSVHPEAARSGAHSGQHPEQGRLPDAAGPGEGDDLTGAERDDRSAGGIRRLGGALPPQQFPAGAASGTRGGRPPAGPGRTVPSTGPAGLPGAARSTVRDASSSTRTESWDTTSVMRPRSLRSRTIPTTRSRDAASSALVGSSSASTGGSSRTARAIATRAASPPDSSHGCRSRNSSARPT